jgi:hypothetical protein
MTAGASRAQLELLLAAGDAASDWFARLPPRQQVEQGHLPLARLLVLQLPTDAFAAAHALYHLFCAGLMQEAKDLALDFARLAAAVEADAGLAVADVSRLAERGLPGDVALRVLAGTLRLAGRGLARDPRELRAQVLGRVAGVGNDAAADAELARFLTQAKVRGRIPDLDPAARRFLRSRRAR